MTQMADNVFMMTSASAGQHVHVLLEAQKLANEVHGQRLLYDLERLKGGGIWAVNATHKYSRAGNGELVPAKVRLYLNATTDAHRRFNERLSRAFEPGAELMDEHYALERGASYRRQIMALRFRQQEAAILAVDHVSRGMPDILEHFCDLTESTTQLRIQEMHGIAREPCYLGKPGTPGRSLRLVPVAVDLSVVLFSSELASSESMPVEMQDIVRSIVKHRDDKTLPCVEVGAFIRAAKAFGSKPRDGVRFFGFCNVRDSQHYVPLMIEWLQANGVLAVDVRRKQLSVSAAKWVPALLDFAPVYLAGGAGRGLGGMSSSPVKSEERFIFYRTWHSRAFSDPSCERLIPVRIGKKWRATRGGWYWGILDTGAGRQTAMEVLSHAVSQEMVVHKIAQRVYLPPIDELLRGGLCGSTIYNRRLMAYAYEKAWSRLDVRGYHEVAPLAYDFFHSYIQRLNDLCGGGKVRWQDVRPAVKQWLEGQVEYLAESVQTVQQRLTKK